jgi:lysozyme
MQRIILDPGHGGAQQAGRSSPFGSRSDRGAREEDMVLGLARDVARRLPPGSAVLTRDGDFNLSLRERRATAQGEAEAFVSLHAGATGGGSEVWVHPAAEQASWHLAETLGAALGAPVRSSEPMAVLDPRGLPPGMGACLVHADIDRLEQERPSRLGEAVARGLDLYLRHRRSRCGANTAWRGNPAEMDVSDAGLAFIQGFEGFRANLYNDPAGHCTIGIGHLVHQGNCNGSEPADFRAGITEERARELLRADAAQAVQAIRTGVTVDLNQAQFDALVSFAFNIGNGAFRDSTLRRRLNDGEYDAVPSELARWVRGGGQVLPGLVRRREAEGRLFSQGSYGGGLARSLTLDLHYGVDGGTITDPFYRNANEKLTRSGRREGRTQHLGIDVSLDNGSGGGVEDPRRGLAVYAVARGSIPLSDLGAVAVMANQDVEQTGLGLSGTGSATLREGRVRRQPWSDGGNAYGGVIGISLIYDYTRTDGSAGVFTLYTEYLHLITEEFPPKNRQGEVQPISDYAATGKGYGYGAEMTEGNVIPADRFIGTNPPLVGYLGATEFPHVHIQVGFASGVSSYTRRPRVDPTVVVPG